MMLKKIYVMFAFIILMSVSAALALNVDVGCPTNVAFQAGATIECLVKNPDTTLGINLMSLTVASVTGGASFLKIETLAGTQKLFESDTYKKGFIGTADKTANVFKITLKANSATDAAVNLKDVVVKTGDDKIYGGTSGNPITIVNNKVTFASAPVPCTANDWDVTWGACDKTCGGGTQSSTVTKKATSTCTTNDGKPATTQSCNTQACSAQPSCTDKLQNQAETGIDCGGPCPACALKIETTDQETYNLLTAIRDGLDALPDNANTLQKISAIASALKGYFK